jgi:hypothetical protein
MKIIKVLTFFLFVLLPEEIFGQGREPIEMADAFREDGKIYVVVLGLVIILTGILIFLIRVDRKIFKLEMRMKKENKN